MLSSVKIAAGLSFGAALAFAPAAGDTRISNVPSWLLFLGLVVWGRGRPACRS